MMQCRLGVHNKYACKPSSLSCRTHSSYPGLIAWRRKLDFLASATEQGQPVLRLRADAVHTANLLRSPACSLFVQAADLPARLLARVTLKGSVEQVLGPERDAAAGLHARLHGEVRQTLRQGRLT